MQRRVTAAGEAMGEAIFKAIQAQLSP